MLMQENQSATQDLSHSSAEQNTENKIIISNRSYMTWLEENGPLKDRAGLMTLYENGDIVFTSPNGTIKFKTTKAAVSGVRPGQNGIDIISTDLSFCVGSFATFVVFDEKIEGPVETKNTVATTTTVELVGGVMAELGDANDFAMSNLMTDNVKGVPANQINPDSGIATAERWLQTLQTMGFPVSSLHVEMAKESDRKIFKWTVVVTAIILVFSFVLAIFLV